MNDTRVKDKKVGMLGLGHVGLTLAATLADVGFTVHGYEIRKEVREAVRAGRAHIHEKGLDELIAKHIGKNLKVVDNLEGENACDIYIVTVGTPLAHNLTPDYGFLEQAGKDLGAIIKKGDLVILRSTVPLGTTRDVVLPAILKRSGLAEGELLIAFAPERTVEGNALEELRTLPQVVGGADEASTKLAGDFFRTMTDTIVELPSLEEAEVVKLINNAYRETVFSFANEVSLVARAWGLDTKRVIKAANEGYARSQVPLPSPGVGGYCLTKDGFLLTESAKGKNVPLHIVPQTRYVSSRMIDSLSDEIRGFLKEHHSGKARPKIAILGFAFKGKPATSDMRGSMTLNLVKRLLNLKLPFTLVGYDPNVDQKNIEAAGVKAAPTLAEAVEGAEVVIIMNNNPAFAAVAPELFPQAGPVLFLDTWGLNPAESFAEHPHIAYRSL